MALAFAGSPANAERDQVAGDAPKIHAPKDCSKPRQEPSRIILACGDANLYVDRLKWTRWGGRKAKGRGRVRAKDCTPSCAEGQFKSYRAKVRLKGRGMEDCGGRRVLMYQRITFRFRGDSPQIPGYLRNLYCNP